jgi:hypothetical protein
MNAFPSASQTRYTSKAAAPVRVVVVYDSLSAAASAQENIQMLVLRNGWRAQTSIWSFDSLARLDTRHASARRAAEANVIFVSTEASTTLPSYVSSWLTHCLRENRHGAPVIAAVYENRAPSRAPMPELRRELTSLAARWRTPLLCNDEVPERLAAELGDLERPPQTTAASFDLERLLASPRRGAWGIND